MARCGDMNIRKLEQKDAEYMYEWMHSDDVVEYLAQNFSEKTLQDCIAFILEANEDETENLHRAICDDRDEYLGTVSLKHIDLKNKNAEYAISMRSKAMGTGAAMYGTKEILAYAFEKLHLSKVYLNVIPENIRAKKFYHKVGFQYEGIFRKHICVNEKLCDLEWYAMFNDMEEM